MIKTISPYRLLWLSLPSIIALALICPKGTFDIQLHDTYFVFASWDLAVLFSVTAVISGSIYRLLNTYKLIQILSIIHTFGTWLSITGVSIISILQAHYKSINIAVLNQLNSFGVILLLLFLIIQIIFIINILTALVKGKKGINEN